MSSKIWAFFLGLMVASHAAAEPTVSGAVPQQDKEIRKSVADRAQEAGAVRAWKSSFSEDEDVSEFAASGSSDADLGSDLIPPEEGGKMTLHSSFPLRIVAGEQSKQDPFSGLPEDVRSPPPIIKKFAIGRCVMTIRSGEYSVSTWRAGEKSEYWIDRDAVLAESVFKIEAGGSLMINVSSEIRLEIADESMAECEARLGGRRILLGMARLDASNLSLAGATNPAMIKPVNSAEAKRLWLNWKSSKRGPFIEDDVAWPALVESEVVEIQPPGAGVFHVVAKPTLVIEKKGAKPVSKKAVTGLAH